MDIKTYQTYLSARLQLIPRFSLRDQNYDNCYMVTYGNVGLRNISAPIREPLKGIRSVFVLENVKEKEKKQTEQKTSPPSRPLGGRGPKNLIYFIAIPLYK